MSEENALAEAQEAIEETPVTEEAVADTENQDASGGEQETETKKERPSRAKDRIRELAADKRAAIEFADLQRQRADELERQLQSLSTPAETKTRPKLADYESPEEWADAVTDWSVEQASTKAAKHVEKTLKERESKASASQVESEFKSSMEAAAERHPDYWDVALDPDATFMNGTLLETVKSLDNAGELIYQLNSNPSKARKIAAMSPARMAAELGRMEVTMNKQPPPKKPKVTEAPTPPTPIAGGSNAELDLAKLSTQDYIKTRREQRKKAMRR